MNTKSGDISFKVQIAADRVPLSDNKLREIYKGDKKIYLFEEEGWHKYFVGPYENYTEAVQTRKATGVYDAFIAAYRNEKKLKLWQAIKIWKSYLILSPDLDYTSDNSGIIIFKVQIAASRHKLSDIKLQNIYPDLDKISMIEEDGWFKYSLIAGINYNNANTIKKQIQVKGAFVVAYKDGKKLKLSNAIRQSYLDKY